MRGFLAETLEMAQKNKIKKIFFHILMMLFKIISSILPKKRNKTNKRSVNQAINFIIFVDVELYNEMNYVDFACF
uniref:Uncharacterized protein n=1 Tax=Histophilus somni (strain 129Pt) TaxID=205914 RepID=Q0I3A0_HISS1